MSAQVKEETQRQVVILVFSLVGTVITVYIVYQMSRPDAFKTLKMRVALTAKRVAQSQVDWWQKQADNAATAYNKEKL